MHWITQGAPRAWLVALVVVALSWGGCDNDPLKDVPKSDERARAVSSDAHIAQVLLTAHVAEMQLGHFVTIKTQSDGVRELAARLAEEHSAARSDLQEILRAQNIAPEITATSVNVEAAATETLDMLRNRAGADLDGMYVDSRVTEHGELLRLIATQLLPKVQDAKLRTELLTTQGDARRHLAMARQLQRTVAAN